MAYGEVRLIDVTEVIRRWLVGESIRAIARATGLDRKAIRRLVTAAQQTGLRAGDPCPDDSELVAILKHVRPAATASPGQIELALMARQSQIQSWLQQEGLLLTKVHELLTREGFCVTYSSLY